jgi:hypothetical protein
MRHTKASWSVVSAVPSGATAASKPAVTMAMIEDTNGNEIDEKALKIAIKSAISAEEF